MPTGFPQTSMGVGRFGAIPPNATTPRGASIQSPTEAGVERPWYASGPFWVLVFLAVGYILVFQTLKG
jgi:hypothetical protein